MNSDQDPAASTPRPLPSRNITAHLAGEVASGNYQAFGALYERLVPALQIWAYRRIPGRLRNQILVDDLLQEIWTRALARFDRFDPESMSFRPWIFGFAKNVLLEAGRARRDPRNHGPGMLSQVTGMTRAEVAARDSSISARLMRDETMEAFRARLEQLPPEDQELLTFCGLEGMPYQQVAERLGLSRDAVAKRWQRLKARLASEDLPGDLFDDIA